MGCINCVITGSVVVDNTFIQTVKEHSGSRRKSWYPVNDDKSKNLHISTLLGLVQYDFDAAKIEIRNTQHSVRNQVDDSHTKISYSITLAGNLNDFGSYDVMVRDIVDSRIHKSDVYNITNELVYTMLENKYSVRPDVFDLVVKNVKIGREGYAKVTPLFV